MKILNKTAVPTSKVKTEKERLDELFQALNSYSIETQRLENAYTSLNGRFNDLRIQYEDTHNKLKKKVVEFDIMTGCLQSILDHIVQGILFIDLNGIVTTYNKAAEAILGIPASKVLFQPFILNFKDDALGFSMKEALSNKIPLKTVCSNYSPEHAKPTAYHNLIEIEVETTFVIKNCPEKTNPSKAQHCQKQYPIQGMIAMIADVTEIRHLQMIANRTSRMKELGEMAAHLAHQIRNPLGGINGFASLLKRDLADNPPLRQMAEYIVEGTNCLNSLIDQVLHFTRPVNLHFEPVDIIASLHEIRQYVLADPMMENPPIGIVIETNLTSLILSIDAPLFKSALLNLIVNAAQAMPHGGIITLKVDKTDQHVLISISDTGIGMSEEHLSKLFSPFFTTKPEGNGLGLAEVQKVIQAHSGVIDVKSKIGQGTTFIIKIPIDQRKP